jgi:hypothetical protein
MGEKGEAMLWNSHDEDLGPVAIGEILPAVLARYGITESDNCRGLCGQSAPSDGRAAGRDGGIENVTDALAQTGSAALPAAAAS